jgi:hypothetical protein
MAKAIIPGLVSVASLVLPRAIFPRAYGSALPAPIRFFKQEGLTPSARDAFGFDGA